MDGYRERIGFSRVGADDCLTPGGLVDYFQDSSNYQSEDVGVGVEDLMKNDNCWILLSWQIVINEMPKSSEWVTVKTWPHIFKGILGERNYTMKRENGEVLAFANAIWTYANISTGKPCRIPKEVSDSYPVEKAYEMEYAPRKIILPEDLVLLGEHRVTRSMIDTNNHMNNSRYVYFGMDYLPENRKIMQFRVEYRQASRLGEKLKMFGKETESSLWLALENEDGEVKAAMEFTFE